MLTLTMYARLHDLCTHAYTHILHMRIRCINQFVIVYVHVDAQLKLTIHSCTQNTLRNLYRHERENYFYYRQI